MRLGAFWHDSRSVDIPCTQEIPEMPDIIKKTVAIGRVKKATVKVLSGIGISKVFALTIHWSIEYF
jgi:hypothetical protein